MSKEPREDIVKKNVFISWTGGDDTPAKQIVRFLNDKGITVCFSENHCSGDFEQWSEEAAKKGGVFLLLLTDNLLKKINNDEECYVINEIRSWRKKVGENFANRTVIVCPSKKYIEEFKEINVDEIEKTNCLFCNPNELSEEDFTHLFNKVKDLIVNRMSRIYADKSASGRSIDITRLLGVDLLDTEETKVDFDKIYIPRSLKFKDEIYGSVKKLADKTNKDILFITAKAGSGKSCFIGQIINEYKNIDGALVLTATCPDAAKYCIGGRAADPRYPVILEYLFKKFIETCKIGESFYTMENFATLIYDRIKRGNDVVVALDAIDEIALQDNTRAFVRHVEELQNFCENKVKVIITDRGQTAAKMFDGAYVCELQEFSDDNVNEYCDKLFDLLEKKELTNKELDINVSDLKDKVKRLSKDIKRNPFMLTQVVSLYAMTGKLNDSEIGMLDDITDVMFKSERLKFGEAMSSNIVEMLSEFAYYRQIKIGEGIIVTREIAIEFFDKLLKDRMEAMMSRLTVEELTYDIVIKYFDELLKKENGKTVERLTGEELTEYIVFREFYNFRDKKFFHESYGEYLTARYFCDKVFNKCGNVVDQEKLDELLSHCGDEHWSLIIKIFIGKSGIKNIVIPEGVKSISTYAFYGCSSLKEVIICEGVQSIGDWGFDGCSSLKEIKMPNSLTDIGEHAFYNCTSLENVMIPKGVISIGNWAFRGCSDLKEVTICEGVKSIGKWVFRGCSLLKDIKMSDSLTDIGERAFYNCTSLEKVTIPKGVIIIGEWAFDGCNLLKEVTICEGVKSIGNCAFDGCSSLKDIKMPDSLTDIGKDAFYNCTSLEKVTIPKGVKSISWSTFCGCSSLKEVIICEGVESIGSWAFRECSLLKDIKMPDSLTDIGERAFYNCTSLEKVTIPKGVINIGNWAFRGCSSLKDIKTPDSLTDIGENAFYKCTSLEKVTIPKGVKSIRRWAFDACSSLKEVIICEGVNSIGNGAFSGCSSLKEIKMPDSLTYIRERTFYECTSIEKITIPKGVISIGRWAFDGCCALKAVYFVNTIGWSAGDDEISPEDLSDPVKAAYLLSGKYAEYEWERG